MPSAAAIVFLLTSFVHGAGWHCDREYRRKVTGGGDADTVCFLFGGGGHLSPGGRDVLVVDGGGTPIPMAVLFSRRGHQAVVAYQGRRARGDVWVYYGGGKTGGRPSTGGWTPKPSLLLITMPTPSGAFRRWRPIASAARSDRIFGMGFVDQVWSGVNPWGPDDHFASAFIGYLRIKRPGRYRIFTASDEASFVLLNGKELVSWPGKHTVDKGRRAQFGKEITLPKGVHKIEYYHAEEEGMQFMALGWTRPGASKKEKYEPIPKEAFVHTPIAKAGPPQRRADRPLAACDWSQDDQLLHGDYQFTRVSFASQCRHVPQDGKVHWDYGDGITHTGNADQHIYVGAGPFPVTVTVTDKDGKPLDRYQVLLRIDEMLKNYTILDRRIVRQYVNAIVRKDCSEVSREAMDGYWQLVETAEDVTRVRDFLSTYVRRFGIDESMWEAADRLALYYSIKEPQRAASLYARLAGDAPTPLDAARARMEQIELILHKLNDPERALRVAQSVRAGGSGMERRIAAIKIGDVYRAQGEFEKAEAQYRKAQAVAYSRLDRRVVAVRQGGFLETAHAHIQHGHLRAAREALCLWEMEYPIGKLSGDLILMTARYFDRIGEAERALAELKTLTEINPLSPYLPEIEYYMARAYHKLGQVAKARQLLEKVMTEYPKSRAAKKARRVGFDAEETLRSSDDRRERRRR
ncbi:MAG: tetratricopeptide repeat protein [Planctomycetota bacterium]